MTIDVSFIIPHKGREQMLLDTLSGLARLDYPKHQFEVILVSQNPDCSERINQFKSLFALTIVHNESGKSISHSRNTGAQLARGEYLAFLDADIALSENWISAMKATLSNHSGVVLASAMQINSEQAPVLERIRTHLSNAELDTRVTFLPGRNLFLSKHTFEQAGGFPEHLETCEDYYFTGKVGELGGLYYTSRACYVHIGEDKQLFPMFKKEIWRGRSNLASLGGRTIPWREWPSFFVPIAICLCLLASIVAFFSQANVIAAGLCVLGIAPVIVYAVRLKLLAKESVSLGSCLMFYGVYFPARAIGTVRGVSDIAGVSGKSKQ